MRNMLYIADQTNTTDKRFHERTQLTELTVLSILRNRLPKSAEKSELHFPRPFSFSLRTERRMYRMRETIKLKRPSLLVPRLHRYKRLSRLPTSVKDANDSVFNLWGRLDQTDQRVIAGLVLLTVFSFVFFDPIDALRRFGLALEDVVTKFNWSLSRYVSHVG